jgi:hypothetical protein
MNHLVGLKSKDIESQNNEPPFLLGGNIVPMSWDRLAENSLRSNSVNSSVVGRLKTQGASSQTTRVNCRTIGQAAAAQAVATLLVTAELKRRLRAAGAHTVNAMATSAVSVPALALVDARELPERTLFAVASTTQLVYNVAQVKLTAASVLASAGQLARAELDAYAISNAMGVRNAALVAICSSIVGAAALDPVWSSWALVVYLASHPRGRDLLRRTPLTDVDMQAALAFERYGGEEIRRREAQRRNGADGGRRRLPSDDDEQLPKRRRSSRASVASSSSDAHSLLDFWHHALMGEDASVLHTLVSHNKRTARDGALSTLARQAAGSSVGENPLLQQVSLKNAVKSAQALVCFVGRREREVPGLALVHCRANGEWTQAHALQRVEREATITALHGCKLPPTQLRAPHVVGVALGWSDVVKRLAPSTESSADMPGVLERLRRVFEAQQGARRKQQTGGLAGRTAHEVERLLSFVEQESERARPTADSGTVRSFISLLSCLCMNATHEHAAAALLSEANELRGHAASSSSRVPCVVAVSRKAETRVEPLCTPGSPLVVGLVINEAVRRYMGKVTRKNNHCLKILGVSSSAEIAREGATVASSEPVPMLTITDVEVERFGEPLRTDGPLSDAPVGIGLHVCGDAAVRLPEMLTAMQGRPGFGQQARAALLVAASQASYVGNVGSALAAGYVNSAVASSKKISVADVNRLMFLSPCDCYVAGLANLDQCFDGTAYEGVYGCQLDHGFTMPGLLAHNKRSDRRQHGALSSNVAQADTP